MRILLDYRPALRQRTGVGEYVHELARALLSGPSHPETLTLFSASWRDRLDRDALAGAVLVDRRVPVRLLNYAWHRWQWPPVEWIAGGGYDVVHAAHPIRLPSRRAAQVITVHDLDFLRHPERTRAEIRRDYPALAPPHIREADAVITVSHHTAREVESLTGRGVDRIVVAPLGRPDWPRRREEPAGGVILFFGTLEPRKNVGGLLEAYARVAARRRAEGRAVPRLIIAGGDGADGPRARARAAEADLADLVEFAGYVDPDARVDLYRRALVLVMPSWLEGFGLPALEAMTVGVPVVASHGGALPEVLGGAGALCDTADTADFAATLTAVLDDPARRTAMRDAGWRRAMDFSWAHTADRTREAWRMAAAARQARA